MESRLQQLNISQLREICHKMKTTPGKKKDMITRLLRPLRKYKMDKITDPRLKGKIMSFLPDNDAANFLVDRQHKVNLQWDMDKRARKNMNKIRKWTNLLNNHTIFIELERTEYKDIGEVFDLVRRGFLTYPPDFLEEIRDYLYRQLEIAVEENNTEILKNILTDKDKIWYYYRHDIQPIVNSLLRQLIEGGSGNIEMYNILLEHGANPNQELFGQSLLNYFLMDTFYEIDDLENAKKIVDTMRNYGAYSWVGTPDGNRRNMTDLMIDVYLQDKNSVKKRLKDGADVNAKNIQGDTALFIAATSISKNLDIIEILLEHHADVNAINNRGESVIDRMIFITTNRKRKRGMMEKDSKIIEILKKHGAKSSK
jgi:hypothetical protein